MKTKLFLISGWSFGSGALAGLADQLGTEFEVTRLAAEDVLSPGTLTEMLPANQPCILAGWSLGGMLALDQAVCLVPGSMLVLIGSTAKFCSGRSSNGKSGKGEDTPHGVPASQVRSLSISLRRQPKVTLANFYDQSALPHSVLPHAAIDHDGSESNDNKALLDGLRYLGERDFREVAANLHVPTLIMHGSEDQVISPAASEDLSRLIRNSKLILRDHVGHDLPIREPSWIASSILDFWKTDVACCNAR